MSVADQWSRISQWCERNAPLTADAFRPSAGLVEIDEAEAATGIGWTNELKELYLVQNGAPSHRNSQYLGGVMPHRRMLSLDESVKLRRRMVDMWQSLLEGQFSDFPEMAPRPTDLAGAISGMFLESFVPFASLDDCHTFVDTRPGPRHGCVSAYEHEDADNAGPRWESVEAMLDQLATSLETGGEFDYSSPRVVDGVLHWEI